MHRGAVSYRRSNNSNFYGRGRSQNRQTYNQTPRHVQANYTYKDAVSNNTNSVVDTTSDKLDRLLKAFDSLEGRLTKMEGLQHTMTSRSGPTNGNHPRDRSRPKQQQQQQQQQPKERSNNPDFAEMTKNLYKVVQLNHQMGHWENDLPLSLQRQFNNLINMIRPADPTTEVQEAISSALRKAGEEVRTTIFNHLRERQLHHLHCLRKCNPEDGDRAKDMAFNWLSDRLGKKIPAVIIERKLDEAYRSVQPRPNPPQTGTSSIDPPQQGTTTTTSSSSSNYITPSNPTKKRKVVVSPVLETSNRFDALTPAVVDDDDDDNDDDDDTEAVRQIEHMSAHTTKANTIKRINRHSGQAKNFWKIKLLPETRTLVVSDSNMKLMKEEEVPDDWQLEVFSGAKIDHVSKLLEELGTDAPTNIVTCVGINHRSHQDSSISKYVRGLRTATGRSPAMVFTMGVSISPHLPATEQQALRTVNERLLADHGERYIVPILPQDVKTGPDGIHYTEETTKKIEDATLTGTETEVEAVEACEWLREAGFPQYAQMYKDNQFPIDLKAAEKDHEFLDDDAIQAFFRRLDVLNKCSSLKLKRSPAKKNSYDSDDEEECALSNKWTFQRNSRLWSRNEANLIQAIPHLSIQPDLPVNGHLHSTSSRESVLDDVLEKLSSVSAPSCALLPSGGENGTAAGVCSEVWNDPVVSNRGFSCNGAAEISKATKLKRPNLFLAPLSSGIDKQDGIISKKVDERLPLNKNKDDVFHNTNNLKLLVNTIHKSDPIQSRNLSDSETISCGSGSPSGDQQKVSIEKVRGPLGIFRRMEGLTTRKSVRKLSKSDLTKKDIGTPVLVESPEILTKIGSLQCMDVGPASENAKCCGQSTIIGVQNSDIQRTPSEDRQILPGAPLLHSLNIPRIAEKHLKCNGDTPQQTLQQNRGICEDRDSLSDSRRCIVGVESPSASEVSSSKDLEDTIDIISELLHTVNLEMSTAKNSRKRISIYDNVSSEVCSVLQNELDALLGELYKNIDSLDYSMSKVTSNQRVESSTSSIGPVGEEDSFKASPTVPPKEHLIAKDSLGSCDSTDGNSSTTPSEGSYSLESAAARHRSTIGRLIEAASAVDHSVSEEAFQLTEDSKCIQTPVEIQSDPDSEDSVEQTAADDWSYPNRGGARERRDSGVGSSLTRTASSRRQKRARLRWHSFAKSHQITLNSYDQPISNLSAGLLAVLRKLSLLKVTAALEKYSPVSRNNWSWFVPRLRRRSKMPDYSERNVFGIPVSVTERRHGQPLPQCILYAMRHLRRSAGVTVGMFRRPGVKMRVQTLRIALETDPDAIDFDGLHAYDVADLLKLYFRELPECLLTNKLSNVFISIFLYIPEDLRRDLIRMTLLLLPDENRLVLQSLLLFLNDIAQHSQLNQMNASNLAVCFAPSLFHLCGAISSLASSPKQLHRRFPAPSEKDLVEQKVAHECLAYMIANVKSVFTVSEEMLSMCKLSYMEHGNPISLEALCRKYGKCDTGNYTAYVDSCIQGVLKESREKFKGWISYSASRGDVDLAYKKVGDGHPLRLWKFCVEVEAPPEEVLNRIMRERHLWDEDILKWRSVEKLDTQTEIFQYVLNSMVPHPTRDFSELRSWRTNLSRGTCVLISTSVEHANARLMGDVRGVVLASRYLIEPCGSGKSRLTHIIRIDLRGHSPDWYNSVYGYICANYARRIRDSFKNSIDLTSGPETKV